MQPTSRKNDHIRLLGGSRFVPTLFGERVLSKRLDRSVVFAQTLKLEKVQKLDARQSLIRFHRLVLTRAKKPAHDGMFDQVSNVVWIKAEAAHRVSQGTFIFIPQSYFKPMEQQTISTEHDFEAIEKMVQGNDTNITHDAAPRIEKALERFTIYLQSLVTPLLSNQIGWLIDAP